MARAQLGGLLCLAALLLLGPLLASAGEDPLGSTPGKDLVIRGRVLDEAGVPMAGMRVEARQDGQALLFDTTLVERAAIDRAFRAPRPMAADSPVARTTTTDALGRFCLVGMRARTRFLVRAVPSPPRFSSTDYTFARRNDAGRLTLYVRPGRVLRGRLVDTEGRGLRGGWIRARAHSGLDRWLAFPWPVRAFVEPACPIDADGRFQLAVPPDKHILLGARRPGVDYVPTLARIPPADDDVTLVYPTTGGASVIGRVRDEDGRPVVGGRVVAQAPAPGIALPHALRVGLTRTDAAGRFEVAHLPATELAALVVEAPGYAIWHRARIRAPLLVERPLDVDVVLVRPVPVRVRVRTPDAQPVAGAEVLISGSHSRTAGVTWVRRTRSNADGMATFPDVPPGHGHVLVEAEGLVQTAPIPQRYGVELRGLSLDSSRGRPPGLVDVVLQPGAALIGRVVDSRGQAVSNASVTVDVRRRTQMGWAGFGTPRCSTDAHGRFELKGLPPSSHSNVHVDHLSYPDLYTVVASSRDPAASPVTLILTDGATIAGRLLDGAGQPLPGFRVNCYGGSSPQVTGPDGRFVFTNVRTNRPSVVSVGDSTQPEVRARLELAPRQVVDDLELHHTGEHVLDGRVVDHAGRPLPDQPVGVSLRDVRSSGTTRVWTRADGTFRLERMPAGHFLLWSGRASADVALPAPAGSCVLLTRPPPRASFVLEGRVVGPDERPVDRAAVRVVDLKDGPNTARASTTVIGGTFRVRVPGATRAVVLVVEESRDARARLLDVVPTRVDIAKPSDAPVSVRMKRGYAIRGTALAEDGEPVPRLHVHLLREHEGQTRGTMPALTGRTTTDDAGHFTFRGLQQGDYHLSVGGGGLWVLEEGVRVAAGSEDVRLGVVRLQDLTVVLRDLDGEPLPGCEVQVWDRTRKPPHWFGTYTTDAAGKIRQSRLRPGTLVTVSVTPPAGDGAIGDLLGARKEAVVGEGPVEVRLRLGVHVAGRVLDPEGDGVPGARVRLEAEGVSRRTIHSTDAEGCYRFRRLPPGRLVRIEAEGPPEVSPRYFPTLARDVLTGREDVDLVLERGVSIEGRIEGVPADALEGVVLYVSSLLRGGLHARFEFDGTTTQFDVPDLRPGAYKVYVRGGRMLVHEKDRTLDAPAQDVVFRTRHSFPLSGVLMGAGGDQFKVEFHVPGLEPRKEHSLDDGLFRFRNMPGATGTLFVWRPDNDLVALVEHVRAGRGDPLIVELVRGRPIRGKVVGQTKPLAKGRVIARRGTIAMEGVVTEEGLFQTPALPPGTYTLAFEFRYPTDGGVPPSEPVAAGSENVVVAWQPAAD